MCTDNFSFIHFLRQSDFCISQITAYRVINAEINTFLSRECSCFEFAITYVLRGCYHYTSEAVEFDCNSGDVSILQRASKYVHTNTVPDSQMYVIYFSLHLPDGTLPDIPEKIVHLPNVSPDIAQCFETIIEQYFGIIRSPIEIKLSMHKLLALIAREHLHTISEKDLNKLQPAIDMLRTEQIGKISVNALAKACGLCEYTFRELFKRYSGVTPKAYINKRCVECVENLYAFSNISVTEAAILCGFDDPSYFFKLYKRVRGRCITANRP